VRFEPVGRRSAKVRCTVCGAQGYDVAEGFGWKATHQREHYPCAGCGKMLVCFPNGKPRHNHKNCPGRKEEEE